MTHVFDVIPCWTALVNQNVERIESKILAFEAAYDPYHAVSRCMFQLLAWVTPISPGTAGKMGTDSSGACLQSMDQPLEIA